MKKHQKLKIILEDKNLIAVIKESNLLTISNEKEKENTLFHYVSEYVKKQNKNNKVYIVHRLDKDTSGIVLFAKNKEIKEYLQNNWSNVTRKYYAIVLGKTKDNDTIKSWLKETKTLLTYSSKIKNDGKEAITKYTRINYNGKYSLLNIELLTGRKNQIRVHMKDNNTPIIGDKKYGIKDNNFMFLYAYYLEFIHPKTKEKVILNMPLPNIFKSKMD